MYVISVSTDVIADDELFRGRHVHIVAGLELTVAHMIFLHAHEGCIMVCFAIAVPILCVLLPLRQPCIYGFYGFLQRTFSVAFSCYPVKVFCFGLRIQLFSQFLQMMNLRCFRNMPL